MNASQDADRKTIPSPGLYPLPLTRCSKRHRLFLTSNLASSRVRVVPPSVFYLCFLHHIPVPIIHFSYISIAHVDLSVRTITDNIFLSDRLFASPSEVEGLDSTLVRYVLATGVRSLWWSLAKEETARDANVAHLTLNFFREICT